MAASEEMSQFYETVHEQFIVKSDYADKVMRNIIYTVQPVLENRDIRNLLISAWEAGLAYGRNEKRETKG